MNLVNMLVIHFTSLVAPYICSAIAMCFVSVLISNFFPTWYAVYLEKKEEMPACKGIR